MGSSRGMPGNYENNYYPRGTASPRTRARRTRVHALGRRERGGAGARGASIADINRAWNHHPRATTPSPSPPASLVAIRQNPELVDLLGENARNQGTPLARSVLRVSCLDNVFVGRYRRLSGGLRRKI